MSFKVSQSKIELWRKCRAAYNYRHVLKLERKHKAMPFMRGTIVHEMLEAHYKGKDPWKPYNKAISENKNLFRVEREEYGEIATNLKNLMTGYFEFYENEDLKPIEVEHEFEVKLPGSKIHLIGKIDLVAKSQKLKWMVEHKCRNKIPHIGVIPYANIQVSDYIWAYKESTGVQLDGIMWNDLWGAPMGKPQLLKDGTMSRRQSATTWPVYRAALKEAGLKPTDYLDMKKQLSGNEQQYYQRKFLPYNKTLVSNVVEDTTTTAKEIDKYAGKDTTRNLGFNCDYCEFKTLCLAQLKGLDYKFIMKAEFRVKEKKK
eukprot:gnl/Spiro4/14480_TR7809_c0_g1_i1.p3 gnl/Spiro4/14480_TR7809_c0_g1~~gnl/Spiro4/14480_TR7809_c0_g1_i1.p3  ORF type:complete len:315 (-),score=-22.14 gnl/Spiro4/14480_TR7809_c0_g1_i1:538-1482(-)